MSRDKISDPDAHEFSYFDLATKGCHAFRILLAGKSGSGKSTLVKDVFDFDDADVNNVQHYTIGEHDINLPILSSNNKALILHDSKGLESGSDINTELITRFVKGRVGGPLDEQVHAIWYCVEIPLGGERLFEGGDIKLFTAIKNACPNIPLVVVFTKLDKLQFQEKRRLKKEYTLKAKLGSQEATARAQEEYTETSNAKYTKLCIDVLKSVPVLKDWARYTVVSSKQPSTIVNLIELTKSMFIESESLSILFGKAQMADVNLKVTLSLRAAKNMLRVQGFESKTATKSSTKLTVRKVLGNIHSDIVNIWNVKDPNGILPGERLFTLITKQCTNGRLSPDAESPSPVEDIEGLFSSILHPEIECQPSALPDEAVGVLDNYASATPEATRTLIAYIIDLTLALENLHWLIHSRKDKTVLPEDVARAFTRYGTSEQRARVYRGTLEIVTGEARKDNFTLDNVLWKINALAEANRSTLANVAG